MSQQTPADYDGKISQDEINELERLRIAFFKAQQSGSADLDDAREAYQTYAAKLLIDLSGKLAPTTNPLPPTEPPKPTEGTEKVGGWGGNPDPDQWKPVVMKKPNNEFKVVDAAGKNIVTNFTTMLNAIGYIDYYRWKKHHDLPPPPPPPPGPTGNKDQFGILMICPSASSGKFETNFKLEEKMRNYNSGKDSEWSTEYTNVSPEVIQNQEVTVYEHINGFKKEADTISLKMGGPDHQDGARFWVIPDFSTTGDPKRTLEIEDPHPHNIGIDPKPASEIGGSIVNKWIGYKGISYQLPSGKRRVESWIHFPVTEIENVASEQDKWRLYMSYETDSKYFKFLGKNTTSRLDGVIKGDPPNYKFASVREITPPTV